MPQLLLDVNSNFGLAQELDGSEGCMLLTAWEIELCKKR